MQLTLLPFEDVNLADCQHLSEKLRIMFPYIIVAPKVAVPQHSYELFRNQYDGNVLLKTIEHNSNGIVLGVTNKDLYSGTLNFIFGMARSPGKSALISLNRLHEKVNVTTFYTRALKEALHEIGLCFGLSQCEETSCLMHFNHALSDIDMKDTLYCSNCLSKLPEEIQQQWEESHRQD